MLPQNKIQKCLEVINIHWRKQCLHNRSCKSKIKGHNASSFSHLATTKSPTPPPHNRGVRRTKKLKEKKRETTNFVSTFILFYHQHYCYYKHWNIISLWILVSSITDESHTCQQWNKLKFTFFKWFLPFLAKGKNSKMKWSLFLLKLVQKQSFKEIQSI